MDNEEVIKNLTINNEDLADSFTRGVQLAFKEYLESDCGHLLIEVIEEAITDGIRHAFLDIMSEGSVDIRVCCPKHECQDSAGQQSLPGLQ